MYMRHDLNIYCLILTIIITIITIILLPLSHYQSPTLSAGGQLPVTHLEKEESGKK